MCERRVMRGEGRDVCVAERKGVREEVVRDEVQEKMCVCVYEGVGGGVREEI